MFERAQGWIITQTYKGPLAHFFKANQSKAPCGYSNVIGRTVYPEQPSKVLICQRCVSSINKINNLQKSS